MPGAIWLRGRLCFGGGCDIPSQSDVSEQATRLPLSCSLAWNLLHSVCCYAAEFSGAMAMQRRQQLRSWQLLVGDRGCAEYIARTGGASVALFTLSLLQERSDLPQRAGHAQYALAERRNLALFDTKRPHDMEPLK